MSCKFILSIIILSIYINFTLSLKHGSISSAKNKYSSSKYDNSYEDSRTIYNYRPTRTIIDNEKKYSILTTTSRVDNLPNDENNSFPNEPSQDNVPSTLPPKNSQYKPPMLYDADSNYNEFSVLSMIIYVFIGIFINSW